MKDKPVKCGIKALKVMLQMAMYFVLKFILGKTWRTLLTWDRALGLEDNGYELYTDNY